MNTTTQTAQEAFQQELRKMPEWATEFEQHRSWVTVLLSNFWHAGRQWQARAQLAAPDAPGVMSDEPKLPEPVDQLAADDGFNVIGLADVFTADQMQAYARQYAQWHASKRVVPDGRDWLDVVREKLARFMECVEDDDADGVDIGRNWLDALTVVGLLSRIQRSPAIWEMTAAGRAMLTAAPAVREGGDHTKALSIATDALDSIALAGMSGSGLESADGMQRWHADRAFEFIRIAAKARAEMDASIAYEQHGDKA